MKFEVHHRTEYVFSEPVFAEPHVLRLSPRPDFFARISFEEMRVDPQPAGIARVLDENGNRVIQIWFHEQIASLVFESRLSVELFDYNPFATLVAPPDALRLPIHYATNMATALQLERGSAPVDASVKKFAEDLAHYTNYDTFAFLSEMTSAIQRNFQYQIREYGLPHTALQTLNQNAGTCRDFTVLFIEAARAMGLAARFVSGYSPILAQQSDESVGPADLHAWAEVFLPGAGWLGFDPTLGIALCGGHLPLAAAPEPAGAAPVSGSFRGRARTELKTQLAFHEI
ncbi:MAG: transglutaminase family protein [bacterium]|nr:transglutaminase family protein [bacterium]